MENFPNSCDKEYMKMAMLKHEKMFREQVKELHRLYRIQKMLMKNISNNRENSLNYTKRSHDLHEIGEQPVEENNDVLGMEDEDEIELTLGPSCYHQRKKAETPLTSESGPSFSSSSSCSSRIKNRDSGLHRVREEEVIAAAEKWGHVEVPNSNSNIMSGRRNSPGMKQDRLQQPPWLFQVLSLNITST